MHCMPCHQPGNIGAMPLTSYTEVKSYARMISYVTQKKIMPPYRAELGNNMYKSHQPISSDEIEKIKSWVNSGSKKGEENIEVQQISKTSGTSIKYPALIFGVKQPFVQKGDLIERTQVFVIPIQLNNDVYIDSIEFVPGNKKIVQSCFVSIDTGMQSLRYDDNDINSGFSSFVVPGFYPYAYNWYYWHPAYTTDCYASLYLKRLPAKCNILLQVNYKAVAMAASDSSYIKFSVKLLKTENKIIHSELFFTDRDLINGPLVIEKDEKKKLYAKKKIDKEVVVTSVAALSHYSCQNWEIYAVDSVSGNRVELLNIPRWDVHWRAKYVLQEPVKLSPGTVIYANAFYNNSEENSNLITLPPQKITGGQGSRNELFMVTMDLANSE